MRKEGHSYHDTLSARMGLSLFRSEEHLRKFLGKVESFSSDQKSNNFKVDLTPLSSVFL